jgi:hypothetical protein
MQYMVFFLKENNCVQLQIFTHYLYLSKSIIFLLISNSYLMIVETALIFDILRWL